MSSNKGTQIRISSSIILEELRQLAQAVDIRCCGDGGGGGDEEPPPALKLSTHAFRPVVVNETLSRISLTPLWRLALVIAIGQLCLVAFYPWSRGAMAEYFTVISHPAAVVMLYVALILVSETCRMGLAGLSSIHI